MRAVVLVGGFGTRLRPLTLTAPKQMLPIVHRPMIEHVLGQLAGAGIDEAVLSLGYRPDAFRDAYPDQVCAGVSLRYAVEPEPLDTAGAIGFAAGEVGIDDRFLVVNGDVLTDLDLGALVAAHERARAEATITLHRVEDPSLFGVVPTDTEGRVTAFVEKPPRDQAPTDLINAGTYVCEPEMLARIPVGRPASVEREVFPAMVTDGSLYAMDGDTYWIDAGTPAQYIQAQLDLLEGLRGPSPDGIHAEAAVDPGAGVKRSVVGPAATVSVGADVVDAVIGPQARIGPGARLTRSVVGPGATVGPEAVVEELSVLGDGEVVAAGEHLVGQRRPAPEP